MRALFLPSETAHTVFSQVNQLLTELDGLEPRRHVFIIAATNRPDMIDPAMLRPGRLDKLLYVPLPVASERTEILRTTTKKMPLADDVSLEAVAADPRAEGLSGADLAGLTREAAMLGLRDAMAAAAAAAPGTEVTKPHSRRSDNPGLCSPTVVCVFDDMLSGASAVDWDTSF